MIEFLVGAAVLLTALFATIQFALLWSGQGAVETAAHFAARKFALRARVDVARAKQEALLEATRLCLQRPGGTIGGAAFTSLAINKGEGNDAPSRACPGDAYRVRLTHWVELVVPFIDRVLYAAAPVEKARLGSRYYLKLHATRLVTVE